MALIKIDNETTFMQETGRELSRGSYLQMFDILKDEHNNKLLNIWKSYQIIYSEDILSYFELYVVQEDDWWENISYRVYGSEEYWWIIALTNKIENPFETLEPGEKLFILRFEYLNTIISDIRRIRDL